MTTSASNRRHLASSPFAARPEAIIPDFEVGDLVSHDSHGMGKVVSVAAASITVDFRPEIVRVASPYNRVSKL